MALKLDITDIKGVKSRYHKIKSFEVADGRVAITIRSYVNQATRDAEKAALDSNIAYETYMQETERMRSEMDELSSQLANGDDSVKDRVVELTEQYNERVSATDQPQRQLVVDRYYSDEVAIAAYVEPLSLDSLYTLLASDGKYQGAESI